MRTICEQCFLRLLGNVRVTIMYTNGDEVETIECFKDGKIAFGAIVHRELKTTVYFVADEWAHLVESQR